MPLPFALPLIPLLKLLALGSIKFILIFVGAFIAPKFTLRFMVNAAAGIVRPVAEWLAKNGHIDEQTCEAARREAAIMRDVEYTRAEAREILLMLSRKTAVQLKDAVIDLPKNTASLVSSVWGKLTGRNS